MSGKNSRNSPYSCAASVLLGAITSVGRCTCWITLAMVKVLPDPVTPSRVRCARPPSRPSVSARMASGWSPAGVNWLWSWNCLPGSLIRGYLPGPNLLL